MIIIIIMGRRNKLSTFEGTNRPVESKIIIGLSVFIFSRQACWVVLILWWVLLHLF